MTGGTPRGPIATASLALVLVVAGGLIVFDDARASAPDDCFEEVPHADVGIVFDESGSMSGEPMQAAREGAQQLTDNLDDGQHSGLVSFDSSAYLRKEVGPDHDATSSAIANLTAGGSTATGDAIDLSHDDILANGLQEGRDVMVVLADGNTNAGQTDPIVQAEQAKADGIEVFAIAFGDNFDEQELKQIASEPTKEYFYDASTDDIEQVFLNIAGEVTERNDSQPPTVSAELPQEGHTYIDGVDQGPNTTLREGRATLVGAMPFQAQAADNCYLEDVELEVPGTGFSYEENATQITTHPFDADAVPNGDYSLDVQATDWVGLVDEDKVGLHVPALEAETRVVGLWAGTATPENPEYRTEGVHYLQDAEKRIRTAEIDQPGLVRAQGLVEAGSLAMEDTYRNTTGEVRISQLALFDGLVEIDLLRHQANASVNLATGETELEVNRDVGEVRVAGEAVTVEDATGPVEVELPGDGFLRLFEREVSVTPVAVSYHSTLVHAHAPDVYGGAEVIVGDVFLEPGGGGEPTPQPRAIARQDDADSGRDAGDEDGDPVEIDTGLYDGQFTPADEVDRYVFEAEHGDKIKVNLEPSSQAHVRGGSVQILGDDVETGGVSVRGELPSTRVLLFDPTGELRAHTIFPGGSFAPQSVEINADRNGTWTLSIDRMTDIGDRDSIDDAYAHYSFDLTVTEHPLLPQNDAFSGSDAPASCQAGDAAIPEIVDGQWPGVVKHEDFGDVYRFHADIGDLVTAALKPGETADGAAMTFSLYDRDCQLLDRSSLGGYYTLKGLPETTLEIPSDYTGTYYVRVERMNGVGNHYVTLSVRDPMPGLPTNDAHTGEDAEAEAGNATAAPPGVFQGTLHEGDGGDAYALSFEAEDDAWVTFEMSAFSSASVALYDPSGDRIDTDREPKMNTYVWQFAPGQAGEHVLVVEPTMQGGGDYTVTWGQAPTSVLDGLPVQSAGLSPVPSSP